MSYDQFIDKTGSVLCLDLGTDIGLSPDQSPGLLMNVQLGLTCQFVNKHPTESISPTLYVIVVYEGAFSVVDGSCSASIGVLSSEDILNAKPSPFVSYKQSQDIFGGGFFDKIKGALQSVHDFTKRNQLISKGLSLLPGPGAQAASQAARSLGYGGRGRPRRARGGAIEGQINLSSLSKQDEDYDEEKTYEEY
jgi:hypothetical protein